jgi:hypothetical protein
MYVLLSIKWQFFFFFFFFFPFPKFIAQNPRESQPIQKETQTLKNDSLFFLRKKTICRSIPGLHNVAAAAATAVDENGHKIILVAIKIYIYD